MSGFDYFKKCVTTDYANFKGRARRSEYWYFVLFQFILIMIPYFFLIGSITSMALNPEGALGMGFYIPMTIVGIIGLATFLPSLAVLVRRLHDVGKSGWFYFIALIPLIGAIYLLVLFCTDSQPGSNQWGPNPKEMGEDVSSHLV